MIINAHVNELKSALSLCMDQTAGITAPLPGEIFTHTYKAAAFTVFTTINWTGLFLIGMLFPLIVVRIHTLPLFLLPFISSSSSSLWLSLHQPNLITTFFSPPIYCYILSLIIGLLDNLTTIFHPLLVSYSTRGDF